MTRMVCNASEHDASKRAVMGEAAIIAKLTLSIVTEIVADPFAFALALAASVAT